MNSGMEGIRQVVENSTGWYHWLPFAGLMVKQVEPANRPMATRLLEQTFVAIIAGGGSAYGTMSAVQAKQEEQIKHIQVIQAMQVDGLQGQMRDSEIRLTSQIVELRARQLK